MPWFTRDFRQTGPFFETRTYHYPNDQPATQLWYHDHALGATRLNNYAGLAGVYLIRDDVEDDLDLPSGDFEIPLVIQDRFFNRDGSLPIRSRTTEAIQTRGFLLSGSPSSLATPCWSTARSGRSSRSSPESTGSES